MPRTRHTQTHTHISKGETKRQTTHFRKDQGKGLRGPSARGINQDPPKKVASSEHLPTLQTKENSFVIWMTEDVLLFLYFLNQEELSKLEGKPISLGFLNNNHKVQQWVMSRAGKTKDHGQGRGSSLPFSISS